jgi:hypothetical protein
MEGLSFPTWLSAVRNLRMAGVSERVAMVINGHKTRAFDRYLWSRTDVTNAMRIFELKGLGISERLAKKQWFSSPTPCSRSNKDGRVAQLAEQLTLNQ